MKTAPTPIFAGVDGGGTRTRVLTVAPDGSCLSFATGNSSNINAVGPYVASANLEAVLSDAAKAAQVTASYGAAFFGMAGVNDSSAARMVSGLVSSFHSVKIQKFEVANDTRALHAATFAVGSGIVLIAGTGSKCYGRLADGSEWEAGGVEYLVSDEGSAFDLAIRGMKAALHSMDGRGEKSQLETLIFDALKLSEYGEISQRLHQNSLDHPGQPMTKTEIAALAKYVIEAWQKGDGVAKKILHDAMCALVETVVAVAKKLRLPSTELQVGITGGVILNEPGASVFKECLQAALPGATTVIPKIPPVAGAALRALELGGVTVTREIMQRIHDTLPEGV